MVGKGLEFLNFDVKEVEALNKEHLGDSKQSFLRLFPMWHRLGLFGHERIGYKPFLFPGGSESTWLGNLSAKLLDDCSLAKDPRLTHGQTTQPHPKEAPSFLSAKVLFFELFSSSISKSSKTLSKWLRGCLLSSSPQVTEDQELCQAGS